MKLISLNIFCGRFFEPLMEFIKLHAPTTDFFCFQEVLSSKKHEKKFEFRSNFYEEFLKAMPDFNGHLAVAQENIIYTSKVEGTSEGVAIFARKNIETLKIGNFFINNSKNSFDYKDQYTFPNNVQHLQMKVNGKILTIFSVHGTSQPGNKLDTPERIKQTEKILEFCKNEPGEKLIAGDFNLFPETKSVKMFEENSYQNLIKNFNIPTTRGSLVKKLHPEYGIPPRVFQEYADFTFATPGLKITKFEVPDLPISDHLPMIIEFELM